jgi:acetyl-CoA C-acetyltransferase
VETHRIGLRPAQRQRLRISLGHPVGATGGRILATLAHEMHRRQVSYGLETMWIGGGQGLAAVFERVE